jgi:hypothetical protein
MSEREKHCVFLKTLIQYEREEAVWELQERINKAEKDERCVRSALRLVLVLAFISVSGLAYSAVFIEDFFQNSSHLPIKIFTALGLGSILCLGAYMGCWLWYRAIVNRVYEEGRQFLIGLTETRCSHPQRSETSVTVSKQVSDDSENDPKVAASIAPLAHSA